MPILRGADCITAVVFFQSSFQQLIFICVFCLSLAMYNATFFSTILFNFYHI